MSCNSCSNITLPGVVGPAGAAGAPGAPGADGDSIVVLKVYRRSAGMPANPAGGSYLFDTNTLTPPSGWSSGVPSGTDPCWVSHGTASVNGTTGTDSSINWSTPPEIAFENGADGITLLHTLTSASSDITSAAYVSALPGVWEVAADTLNTNGDTLRLQAQTMVTLDPTSTFQTAHGVQVLVGSTNPPTIPLEIANPSVPDYLNGIFMYGNLSYILEIDMVRVSDTSIRIESKTTIVTMNPLTSDYANEVISETPTDYTTFFSNSSQIVTVSDLDTSPFYVDTRLKRGPFGSDPSKLLCGKLYWLNKLVNA